ncbi:uncharacterized protein LOC119769757 isoform X1 [Culex quinquefasciatus]|uniref:uncharacterized protein LOC119769757 isoform X1 n=1 Tax=Culex quinquefasciatus TaxID=7176 RepID=UPI0018E3DAFD|nr:uncharacterized protein LOC119769757 isoform X1 [Culex quinquefasciatus]
MSERTRKECSLQLEREFLSDTGFAVRGKPPQPPYSFLGNQSTKQAHLWHRPALCSSAKQEAHKKVPSATSVPQIGAVGGKLHYMKICPAWLAIDKIKSRMQTINGLRARRRRTLNWGRINTLFCTAGTCSDLEHYSGGHTNKASCPSVGGTRLSLAPGFFRRAARNNRKMTKSAKNLLFSLKLR